MKYFADNSLSIGNTPLVRLNKVAPGGALVLAKIEGRNPAYSVKCRIGTAMIADAERRGVLKPGMEVVVNGNLLLDSQAQLDQLAFPEAPSGAPTGMPGMATEPAPKPAAQP